MMARLTLGEILGKAIQKEVESRLLYINLSRKTNDQSARDAFRELARQEQGHQNLLQQYLQGELKGGALSSGAAVDYKIAERLEQPEISPDIKLKDAFMLAANREKVSYEFYLGLAQIHPHGKVKRLIEELAEQELGHKHKVEFLYTEVAFPQTDGG
ncbi:ferritin family protein [Chloroflexota bacterium]